MDALIDFLWNHNFGARDTQREGSISNKGYFTDFIVTVPKFENDVTAKLSVHDEEDNELFSSDPLPMSKSSVIKKEWIPACDRFKVRVTLSDVPMGSGGTVKVRSFMNIAYIGA